MKSANLDVPTSAKGCKPESRWAVILSGGEGERLRPLVDRPKQYCTFVGTRTMLQHTLDRAASMVSAEQILTVIGSGHRKFLGETNGHTAPGSIIEQPTNLGTALGILLPTAFILEKNPNATIIVLPSDHFAYPESKFIEHMIWASQFAEQFSQNLVLIGAAADRPEVDYGWITAEDSQEFIWASNGKISLRRVSSFREKPGIDEAHALLRENGLWNTMTIAVKARTLWSLAGQCLPHLLDRLDTFRQILHAVRMGKLDPGFEKSALAFLYQNLSPADFSTDILQRIAQHILVLPMTDVTWCDWGRPRRVTESLARLREESVPRRKHEDHATTQMQ